MTRELKNYWEKRASKLIYSALPSVGHNSWGYEINKLFYQEQEDQLNKLKRKLKIEWKDKMILDAGCGIGVFSEYFEKHGAYVVGVDFSITMLKTAKQNTINLQFVQGDLKKLPFKNQKFDMIFTSNVLIHIVEKREWELAVLELKRTVKNKIIFIQDFRNFHPMNKIDYCRLREKKEYEDVLNMKKTYNSKFLYFIQNFAIVLVIMQRIFAKILYLADKLTNFGPQECVVYEKIEKFDNIK
ncbi:MAG: class I SAM-dependent methyltransferase [Candidatus Methanoperedens sp.]|nr:class I SAM-dependent methyltransferase [Candidatus Methanoperedens sp.]